MRSGLSDLGAICDLRLALGVVQMRPGRKHVPFSKKSRSVTIIEHMIENLGGVVSQGR